MRAYVLFEIRERSGGQIAYQILRLGQYRFTLAEARTILESENERGVLSHILRLPDSEVERSAMCELQTPGTIRAQSAKWSSTLYVSLTPLDDEEVGVWYISAVAPRASELSADMIGLPYGTIGAVVYFRGSRFSLTGEHPSPPTKDIWQSET